MRHSRPSSRSGRVHSWSWPTRSCLVGASNWLRWRLAMQFPRFTHIANLPRLVAGLVATFAYDVKTERVQISEGYAAIYGFPEGTTEIARSQWRTLVVPDDLKRLESLRSKA